MQAGVAGHARDRLVLDDLPHAQDGDRVLLAGEREGQVLRPVGVRAAAGSGITAAALLSEPPELALGRAGRGGGTADGRECGDRCGGRETGGAGATAPGRPASLGGDAGFAPVRSGAASRGRLVGSVRKNATTRWSDSACRRNASAWAAAPRPGSPSPRRSTTSSSAAEALRCVTWSTWPMRLVDLRHAGRLLARRRGDLLHQVRGLADRRHELAEELPRALRDLDADEAARPPISLAAAWLRSASLRTSAATTAKPRPCSPARAASMAAFSASRFVW